MVCAAQLFGWDLGSLWQTANQRRCDAFLRADRVVEAVESHQYMMRMIDDAEKSNCLEWSTGECCIFLDNITSMLIVILIAFKKDCISRCVEKGDEAVAANNYERAIELYSAAIGLDSSCDSLFLHRTKTKLAQNLFAEALPDADMVRTISIIFSSNCANCTDT